MGAITDIFEIDTGEKCECEDCGETKRLQYLQKDEPQHHRQALLNLHLFGSCMVCGGNVVECEDD